MLQGNVNNKEASAATFLLHAEVLESLPESTP